MQIVNKTNADLSSAVVTQKDHIQQDSVVSEGVDGHGTGIGETDYYSVYATSSFSFKSFMRS